MNPEPARIGPLQIVIILLAVATAAIHLFLAFVAMPAVTGTVDIVFLLNGLGYLALVAALYLPLPFLEERRPFVRWVLVGYTAVTILAWFLLASERTTLGYVDKLIEIALIVLLYLDSQQRSRA